MCLLYGLVCSCTLYHLLLSAATSNTLTSTFTQLSGTTVVMFLTSNKGQASLESGDYLSIFRYLGKVRLGWVN